MKVPSAFRRHFRVRKIRKKSKSMRVWAAMAVSRSFWGDGRIGIYEDSVVVVGAHSPSTSHDSLPLLYSIHM
ncbi:MAG: exported protein of unknown function [Methanothrix sp.]|nr:MAG: exported protein of unknown function [Methanothrix sp.]